MRQPGLDQHIIIENVFVGTFFWTLHLHFIWIVWFWFDIYVTYDIYGHMSHKEKSKELLIFGGIWILTFTCRVASTLSLNWDTVSFSTSSALVWFFLFAFWEKWKSFITEWEASTSEVDFSMQSAVELWKLISSRVTVLAQSGWNSGCRAAASKEHKPPAGPSQDLQALKRTALIQFNTLKPPLPPPQWYSNTSSYTRIVLMTRTSTVPNSRRASVPVQRHT